MNLDRHMKAHKDLFYHLVRGDGDSAEKHRDFYDEYLAVMDLTAEFYLQTIDQVFVRHLFAKGEMVHRGRRINLSAIKRVALMTVEGEKDDITGVGQCAAALDLCSGIPADNKYHFECPGVGHYGIFNGSRFRSEIAPRIAAFVRRNGSLAAPANETLARVAGWSFPGGNHGGFEVRGIRIRPGIEASHQRSRRARTRPDHRGSRGSSEHGPVGNRDIDRILDAAMVIARQPVPRQPSAHDVDRSAIAPAVGSWRCARQHALHGGG